MVAVLPLRADQQRSPFSSESASAIAGRFGMWLLLMSLAMLFGASLVAFLVIRIQLHDSWPADQLSLPPGLWISTGILLLSSGAIHMTIRAARDNRKPLVTLGLAATFLLGLVFLIIQVQCWVLALAELRMIWLNIQASRLAATGFYVFSGVHGLHVIGGLIPLSVIVLRASRGRYSSDHLGPLQYIAMYWHFLDVVWIVLFATLLIGM